MPQGTTQSRADAQRGIAPFLSWRRRAFTLLALALSLAWWPWGACQAALDPETTRPYHLRVVLGMADNRILTPVFKEQVQRELHDSLQADLGDLATVEVVDSWPRLKDVEDNGLEILDSIKDWPVEDAKTHFVLIDFVNGQYEIQARQHDGLTGQTTGVVRHERTPDRQFVARTAALLVGRDFGLVGTVDPVAAGKDLYNVTFKGGGLDVTLGRWVAKDDVLALVQISAGDRAARVPWALLRVDRDPEKGVSVCQLFNRYANPLEGGPNVLGYRCLRLSTTEAPLRIRLVRANEKALIPVGNQQIHVRHRGFTDETGSVVQGTTDPDGYFSTDKGQDSTARTKPIYNKVAFVSVVAGTDTLRVKIPVPILDDRTVVIPVNINQDPALELAARRDQWVSDVNQSLVVLVDQFKDLDELLKKKDRAEALKRARAELQSLDNDLTRLQQEREGLVQQTRSTPINLTAGDDRLKELRNGQKKLQDFVARLDKAVNQDEPRQKELQAKLSEAQLLEEQADYGKALELYDQILKDADVKDPELKRHVADLHAKWEIKSEKHLQARTFIYNVWPKVDLLKRKDRLEEAREAFETCRDVGDTLTLQKLLREALVVHATNLQKTLAGLQPDVKEDDRNTAKLIAEVSENLAKLVKDVQAYLDRNTPAPAR